MSTRIVIAHRSSVLRDVVRLLGASRAVVVVGETSRSSDLAGLCEAERPDVAVVEPTFHDGTEIESLLADVRATGARALVLGGDPSPERLTRVLLLGASGYLYDDASPEQVVEAIGVVGVGGSVLGPAAAATILEQWRRLRENQEASETSPGTLTARERDVLVAMTDGLGAKSIARRLGVAVKTVESHKFRIFDKLGVHTQAHAVSVAVTHGLLTAPLPPSPAAPMPVPGGGGLVGHGAA